MTENVRKGFKIKQNHYYEDIKNEFLFSFASTNILDYTL